MSSSRFVAVPHRPCLKVCKRFCRCHTENEFNKANVKFTPVSGLGVEALLFRFFGSAAAGGMKFSFEIEYGKSRRSRNAWRRPTTAAAIDNYYYCSVRMRSRTEPAEQGSWQLAVGSRHQTSDSWLGIHMMAMQLIAKLQIASLASIKSNVRIKII